MGGITIALAFNWIFAEVFPAARQYQASVPLFFAYWVAAALVFWAGRRSHRVAGLVGIDIAVLDMPAVFFLQLTQLLRNPDLTTGALSVLYFALLTVASAFSLEPRRVILTAVTGTVLQLVLMWLVGGVRRAPDDGRARHVRRRGRMPLHHLAHDRAFALEIEL